jgi:hypothetical protein
MDPLVIGVIVVAIAIVGFLLWQRRRSEQLRARYGSEYDRTVAGLGRRRAESELADRERRVEQLNVRPLAAAEREHYVLQWRQLQALFVDDPRGAVTQADRLLDEVMNRRGYPLEDFDQRMADLSVHHARVLDNYRAAREITLRHRRGEATTEDLRRAMVYFRALFVDLLESDEGRDEHGRESVRDASRAHDAERVVDRRVERDDLVDERVARPEPRNLDDREMRP